MKKTKNINYENIYNNILYEYTEIISPYIQQITYYDELQLKKSEKYYKINEQINSNLIISSILKNKRTEISKRTNYKYKNALKEYVNDFPYILKKYLMINNYIDIKISNAFTKLYEILFIFNKELFNDLETIKAYHMAEAPGMWIKCMEYYINKTKNIGYEWYANSLNPDNAYNKKKYNVIFDDKYGLMSGENSKKWLYGKDNTGDIMNVENIININKTLNEKKFVSNLITSDAGIDVKTTDLYTLQKLDYAQLINVMLLSNENGNIIIKTFLPFIVSKKESLTKKSIEFFISIIYIYTMLFEKIYLYKPMSSNLTSGEFYIIGIRFNNKITNNLRNELSQKLTNFEINIELVPSEFISNFIKYQILKYLNKILEINNLYIEIENDLLTIMENDKLSDSFTDLLNKIKLKKINYWLDIYDFI